MRSSGEAGGLKESANTSMSSRNLVAGMPRSFFPSVMESRLMFATASSSLLPVSMAVALAASRDMVCFVCLRFRGVDR